MHNYIWFYVCKKARYTVYTIYYSKYNSNRRIVIYSDLKCVIDEDNDDGDDTVLLHCCKQRIFEYIKNAYSIIKIYSIVDKIFKYKIMRFYV